MSTVPTALYLDFDNVFSGLLKLEPRLALRFAEEPALWVNRLASELLNDGERRWLVMRCYMNPAGSVPHPDGGGSRLYFHRFRLPFTDAGFEVVDCPRLTHTKNGADIKLVLDAAEALLSDVRYAEFVIASGDSDMTPLLVRIRAADRQTTILSPSDSAEVLGAIANRLIGGEELLELLDDPPAQETADVLEGEVESEPNRESLGLLASESAPPGLDADQAHARFQTIVHERYNEAEAPLNLAVLAHELRADLGPVVSSSRWFGQGGFTKAIQALQLPNVRMSQHVMWDTSRHPAPDEATAASESTPAIPTSVDMPEPVARVTAELRLPKLEGEVWPRIYESLAEFVSAYEFGLTEATKWTRDRLVEAGVEVNRRAVGLVARGSSYGGCPLYRKPPPTPEEIGSAFVSNVINRAAAADIELNPSDEERVRSWFGA